MTNETVMDKKALQEYLLVMIPTDKVRVRETDGVIQLVPLKEKADCTVGLRGILANYDVMSIENFLERKHADKELDL